MNYISIQVFWGFLGGSSGKEPPATAGDIRDTSSIPGSGRSPGGGHGKPPQYSCLENPMDRGAWQATVHGVAVSDMTEATSHTHVFKKYTCSWRQTGANCCTPKPEGLRPPHAVQDLSLQSHSHSYSCCPQLGATCSGSTSLSQQTDYSKALQQPQIAQGQVSKHLPSREKENYPPSRKSLSLANDKYQQQI